MFFTQQKLASRIREIEPYRYRGRQALAGLTFQLDPESVVGAYPPNGGEWQDCDLGQRWRGKDLYVWLRSQVTIPSEWDGHRVLLRYDFGGPTGGGNTAGFESLLFINGHPYQGVDANHKEVFLAEDWVGESIQLHLRLWSGLPGGGKTREMEIQLVQAELCWLDEATDDFFYTALATLETIRVLEENSPEAQELLKAVNYAFREVDWNRPGSEEFYASVEQARSVLRDNLDQIQKHHPVTVTCIGHTHIDVAWLWQIKHTQEKSARSFSTVLRLMEMFPEYIFIQSQPQLYQYIKEDYPEIYEQIKPRIAEGRWEADGAMWVEADCNLSSGESLVRQILLGNQFFQKEFGITSKYLWLPDVFGYSWALPQILKKSGIDTFMTTKISWNQYNRLPHDTFMWRGIDGTEILTHFITTPDQGGARFYTYNGNTRPFYIKGIWDNYRDKNLNQELLLAYGYGDGGGGVNRDMLEVRRRLEDMPGLPNVQTGRADDYFARLHNTLDESEEYIHTWDGELYLEYHRGTYTSQGKVKWYNRKLELALRKQEWLEVYRSSQLQKWNEYPVDNLTKAWQTVLLHQFHDIIPGSSIQEVYVDTLKDYQETEAALNELEKNVMAQVVQETDGTYTVWNNSTWEHTGLVEIPWSSEPEVGSWQDAGGNKLEAVALRKSWLVKVEQVPALGYSTIYFTPEATTTIESPFTNHSQGIDTPFYQMRWNDHGQITRLYDLENKREVLAEGARANVLQIFEDRPMAHDAWDIDLYYQEKMYEVTDLRSIEVVEQNALRSIIRFQWRYERSEIRQDLILYSHTRRIDFSSHVDWQQRRQLMKASFPVEVRAVEATFDIQFGNVKRPTHWNTSWDWARFETVAHHWADLSEQGYGVSLLNDSKYGYDIKGNVMRLSLLKGATYPDHEADLGEHKFVYSLYPHKNDWLAGKTVQEAWELNQPLVAVPGKARQTQYSMFTVEGMPIVIDAIKKAEEGDQVVVRFHEYSGGRGRVRLHTSLPVISWQECNLMEEPEGELQKGTIELDMKPYEIKTLLLTLDKRVY